MKCAFYLVYLGPARSKRSQTLLLLEKTMSFLKWCVCVCVWGIISVSVSVDTVATHDI